MGSVVEPEGDMSVGDVVCFTSSLLTEEGEGYHVKVFFFFFFVSRIVMREYFAGTQL